MSDPSDLERENLLRIAELTVGELRSEGIDITELSEDFMKTQSGEINKQYYQILPVFDKDKKFTGRANWYVVHKFGFRHIGIGYLLFDRERTSVLLQHRADSVSFGGKLDCTAGGHYKGECYFDVASIGEALREEVADEVFADEMPRQLVMEYSGSAFIETADENWLNREHWYLFSGSCDGVEIPEPDQSEIKRFSWLKMERLLKIDQEAELAPGLQAAIRIMKSEKG